MRRKKNGWNYTTHSTNETIEIQQWNKKEINKIKSTKKYTSIQVDGFHCSEYIATVMTITVLCERSTQTKNAKENGRKAKETEENEDQVLFGEQCAQKKDEDAEWMCCDRWTFDDVYVHEEYSHICVFICIHEKPGTIYSMIVSAGCPVFGMSSWSYVYVYFQNEKETTNDMRAYDTSS